MNRGRLALVVLAVAGIAWLIQDVYARMGAALEPTDEPPVREVTLRTAEGLGEDAPALEGTRGADAPPPAPPAGTCRVIACDAAGKRLRGAFVDVHRRGSSEPIARAFAPEGEKDVGPVPLDGSVRVEVFLVVDPVTAQPRVIGRATVDGPRAVVRCDTGLPLRATILEADSGRERADIAWRPEPLAANERPYRKEHSQLTAFPGPDRWILDGAGIGIELEADAGYVAWEPSRWDVRISRYATALSVHYPLRREARVRVVAEEPGGAPSRDARIEAFQIAGRQWHDAIRTTPAPEGWILHGVPYYREEPLDVFVVRPSRDGEEPPEDEVILEEVDERTHKAFVSRGAASAAQDLPAMWDAWADVRVRFPEDAEQVVRWGGSDGVEVDNDLPHEESFGEPEPQNGDLEVTVVRAAGRPAVGAQVRCGNEHPRTDLRGSVRFLGLEAGPALVALQEYGLVHTSMTVAVRPGTTTSVRLEEGQGADLRVLVVDAQGKALPFARVGVPDALWWADLRDGVQRLDPYTDRDGRRTLPRLPPGRRTLVARWGGRSGSAKVTLRDGVAQDVTITLP